MKHLFRFLGLVLCIAVVFSGSAIALSGDEEVFGDAFCEPLNPKPGTPFGVGQVAVLNDVFYGYLGDTIYAWKPGDAQPKRYSSPLPAVPEWKEEWRDQPLKALYTDDQTALTGAVEYIAAGDGALWGYNTLSGRYGQITEQGITWAAQTLDTAGLFQGDTIMLNVVPNQSFVSDGKLYIFGDYSNPTATYSDNMILVRFDLSNGKLDILETKTAVGCCLYKPGFFLLVRRGDSSSMILSTLDMATGALEDLPLTVPFPDRTREGLESVGGLTYDPTNDRILFSMDSQVWASEGGKPFASVAKLPMESCYSMPAWVLPDGRYAILSCSLLILGVD